MNFQDELNNMKMHSSDSESKLKSAADDVAKMVVRSLKSSASNCIAGTKLNCDFLLECSCFFQTQNINFQRETFSRPQKIELYYIAREEINKFLTYLSSSLQPYCVKISGFAVMPFHGGDDVFVIYTSYGQLQLLDVKKYVDFYWNQRTPFNPITPYTVISKSINGFVKETTVCQNGQTVNISNNACPVLMLSYRES